MFNGNSRLDLAGISALNHNPMVDILYRSILYTNIHDLFRIPIVTLGDQRYGKKNQMVIRQ